MRVTSPLPAAVEATTGWPMSDRAVIGTGAIAFVAKGSPAPATAEQRSVANALVSSDDLRTTKALVSNDVGAAPA
jgi:hypothetical protein